jgi:hypothetical protein
MRRLAPVAPWTLLLPLSLAACGEDRIVKRSCPEVRTETVDETVTTTTTTTEAESSFDIEQVSVLEATDVLENGADAVILDHDSSQLPPNSTWRVSHVDVLVMVPSWAFAGYPASLGLSSVGLTVEVWDTSTPIHPQKPAYRLEQQLDPARLSWDTVSLPTGTYKKAWWTFPLTAPAQPVITQPMTAQRFLVGVRWDTSGEPRLGYSDFNRPCDRNWTDPGDGTWNLNSTFGQPNTCSWPMLRVGTEVTTEVTKTETVPVTRTVTVMVERDECAPNPEDVVLDAGVDAAADAGSP